jgi:DNA-binding transcriptional ArsR family regulator
MNESISDVFAALADDTRRGIYERLLANVSGLTATELSHSASVSRQAIVKHLQVLERSGLAEPERDGRDVRYFVATGGTKDASQWLLDHAAAWDRRIAALEEKVRASKKS